MHMAFGLLCPSNSFLLFPARAVGRLGVGNISFKSSLVTSSVPLRQHKLHRSQPHTQDDEFTFSPRKLIRHLSAISEYSTNSGGSESSSGRPERPKIFGRASSRPRSENDDYGRQDRFQREERAFSPRRENDRDRSERAENSFGARRDTYRSRDKSSDFRPREEYRGSGSRPSAFRPREEYRGARNGGAAEDNRRNEFIPVEEFEAREADGWANEDGFAENVDKGDVNRRSSGPRRDSDRAPRGQYDRGSRNDSFQRGGRSDSFQRGGGSERWQGSSGRSFEAFRPLYPEKQPRKYQLEGAEYIYGVGPVTGALLHGRRTIHRLFVKEPSLNTPAKKDRSEIDKVEAMAKEKGIPIEFVDKGMLNVLSDNRPHQGLVMDVGALDFTYVKSLPAWEPEEGADPATTKWPCVLALDEVWDPQNFGALLRSAHFLGAHAVVVCSRNSAPLSGAVSKASAGAMEAMQCQACNNMPKFLEESKQNGWAVVGTSLDTGAIASTQLSLDKPTILVLGNEAYGLRTNVKNACDTLAYIPGRNFQAGPGDVDSLNVSVAGGIFLYTLLSKLQ